MFLEMPLFLAAIDSTYLWWCLFRCAGMAGGAMAAQLADNVSKSWRSASIELEEDTDVMLAQRFGELFVFSVVVDVIDPCQ